MPLIPANSSTSGLPSALAIRLSRPRCMVPTCTSVTPAAAAAARMRSSSGISVSMPSAPNRFLVG